MNEVTWTAGEPDENGTVEVTFTQGYKTHMRTVNAVFDDEGVYDVDATAARISEVAIGVANKWAVGAIPDTPPEPIVSEPAPE